jgi:hypothetical protein
MAVAVSTPGGRYLNAQSRIWWFNVFNACKIIIDIT